MKKLEYSVLILNTAGLLAYLVWIGMGFEQIFYTQEGVLYLLPSLPFFFVYVFVARKHKEHEEADDAEETDVKPNHG